eukprot:1677122-Pleurochrysis_carterae.AAC.1
MDAFGFGRAPSDEPFASPMRLILYKVQATNLVQGYATDLTQSPCDWLYIESICRISHGVQRCIHTSKPMMTNFGRAPSNESFATPMRWTLCKAHATDVKQGPCNGLYVGCIR